MSGPRIVYTGPQSDGDLLRRAIVYGLMCALMCGMIWLGLKTGRLPSRLGFGEGIGAASPFFYLAVLVYGLMTLLTGWLSSHAALTLIDRRRRGPRGGMDET